MAWSNSKIFSATITDIINNTTAMDGNSDTHKAALYGTTPTPDQTVAAANTAYNVGQWITGSQVVDAVSWPAVGRDLAGVASGFTTNVFTFDANDTVSADATTDLAAVFGCLVYDDTITTPVADQGWCYNYFGGSNSVVNGTFTIVWAAAGIFALTL